MFNIVKELVSGDFLKEGEGWWKELCREGNIYNCDNMFFCINL